MAAADDNPMRRAGYRARLAWRLLRDRRTLHVPPGHPYSPLPSGPDVDRAVRRADSKEAPAGIDLREEAQLALLRSWLGWYAELPFGDEPGPHRYGYANTWFGHGDAVACALMLRHLAPRRLVEVGCGHSSALVLDVDELYLGGRTELTFIEPAPERLRSLARPGDLDGRLLVSPVQDVPLEVFDRLGPGDVLMIDSSHVLKAGSDVAHLLDEVLPRLAPGVHVHVHDVFAGFEYPSTWLRSGVALNEAYAWRLLLQEPSAYEVMLFHPGLARSHRAWVEQHLPLLLAGTFPTGGVWVRRAGRAAGSLDAT